MISSLPKWVGNLFESSLRPNMKVLMAQAISPRLRKIRFQGNLSGMHFELGYASVLRVSATEFRNYTVAHHDIQAGLLDIVFHLHGNGAGSHYIESLNTGDDVFISPPRGMKEYDPKARQQLIFGDETSLGLACAFLPVLKQNGHEFRFYLELDEENKDAPALLGLEHCTVFPKNGSFRNEAWIGELPVFQTAGWQSASCVLTGNVRSVQTFRKVLKSRSRGKVFSKGYWLEGKKGL